MRLTCQACGAVTSLDVAVGHDDAAEALRMAFEHTPFGQLLVRYIGLFRPAKRQLTMDRVASLLGEILPMIESARVERGGRTYVAPQDYWRMAIETMLVGRDKLTLPLKSHGYLLEIIVGYADKAEARQETKTEEDRKHRAVNLSADAGKVVRKPKGMPSHISDSLGQFRKPKGENDGDNA